MTQESPYLSFVIAGRNDDYGGDFNYRLNNSIYSLSYYIEKYQLPCEYIVVNYNPVADKKTLYESLNWPKDRRYLKFRIITVPGDVHKTLEDPEIRETVPLYEYIAKNVGIQRAKAPYICAANPDIIYSPEVIEYLSRRQLDPRTYYRVDRCDFERFEWNGITNPDDLLVSLKNRTFRIFLKGNTYLVNFPNSFEKKLSWLRERNLSCLEEKNATSDSPPEYYYHCNCSGDFMLLHKDQWKDLKGNPEKTLVAAHTDAMFVIMAASSGLKEEVLPWPVYHQNHDRRYDCDGDFVKPSVEVMYKRYVEAGKKMLKERKPILNSHDNWGLVDHQFEEEEF